MMMHDYLMSYGRVNGMAKGEVDDADDQNQTERANQTRLRWPSKQPSG